ncbi:MAG: RNA 2',3'-cyclic phosphodiesterase [Pseudomonadota bacterium]
MRLFAALPIRPDIADLVVPLQKGVTGASWRPRENFHITLRFFGDVDHTLARQLDEEIAAIPARQMKLRLKGAGWFGKNEPRALWLGVDYNEALKSLAAKCERAARRSGLPSEKRKFLPHLTLAYCHGTPVPAAETFAATHAGFASSEFWVDRFHLYSSELGHGPSRYRIEADYPLN